jgi:predicted dehydrogenase
MADGTSETIGASATSGAGADPMAFTSDWHQTIIEDFADAIAEDRPPIVTGRAALDVHQLIDAIEKAGRLGERVTLTEFLDGL